MSTSFVAASRSQSTPIAAASCRIKNLDGESSSSSSGVRPECARQMDKIGFESSNLKTQKYLIQSCKKWWWTIDSMDGWTDRLPSHLPLPNGRWAGHSFHSLTHLYFVWRWFGWKFADKKGSLSHSLSCAFCTSICCVRIESSPATAARPLSKRRYFCCTWWAARRTTVTPRFGRANYAII